MDYIDKSGKMHEGLEDMDLDNWIWKMRKDKKDSLVLIQNEENQQLYFFDSEPKGPPQQSPL